MYNLIDCSDVYSKTSGSLWLYYKNEPPVNANGEIIDFSANNKSDSSRFKQQIAGHNRYWNNTAWRKEFWF